MYDDMYMLLEARPDIFTQKGINNIYKNLVHTLVNCGIRTVDQLSKPSVTKFWWDSSLSDAKRECLKHHDAWVSAGKPVGGNLFTAKNIASKKYKKAIFEKKKASSNTVSKK